MNNLTRRLSLKYDLPDVKSVIDSNSKVSEIKDYANNLSDVNLDPNSYLQQLKDKAKDNIFSERYSLCCSTANKFNHKIDENISWNIDYINVVGTDLTGEMNRLNDELDKLKNQNVTRYDGFDSLITKINKEYELLIKCQSITTECVFGEIYIDDPRYEGKVERLNKLAKELIDLTGRFSTTNLLLDIVDPFQMVTGEIESILKFDNTVIFDTAEDLLRDINTPDDETEYDLDVELFSEQEEGYCMEKLDGFLETAIGYIGYALLAVEELTQLMIDSINLANKVKNFVMDGVSSVVKNAMGAASWVDKQTKSAADRFNKATNGLIDDFGKSGEFKVQMDFAAKFSSCGSFL